MDAKLKTNLNSPQSPPAALLPYCRDLQDWPESWMGEEKDLPPGRRLVECFTPFLVHLAASGLSKRTIQKHVDHLWILGGEIIRDLNETPKLRRHPMEELLHSVLEADGPLIYHSDFEEQQRSLDATCRKFRTYLSAQPR